ncbi:hypothetical protein PINS_up000209 [Pythium insidiosum]|nr:hypothetical protein PINS_up000209 [Pythium insidiosum]
MHGVLRGLFAGATLAMTAVSATSSIMESAASFGTFVRCESSSARCLWVGEDGALVERDEMMRQLMASEDLDVTRDAKERRRLEHHVQYIEDVHRIAADSGVAFSYKMGVNTRHLYLDDRRTQTPAEFVRQEAHARRRRRLEEADERRELTEINRRLDGIPKTLNWCSDDNPKKKNICTPIKSQNKCGSCWAFAASDAIETAVAVASDTQPIALSPQQFLDCSRREMTATFQYCWAQGGVSGAPWLMTEMKWASQNNGCDGGMTHGAFMDAATMRLGLLSQLDLPYTETVTETKLGLTGWQTRSSIANRTEEEKNTSCQHNAQQGAASIENWEQAVGRDCSKASKPTELLKIALQRQPISVAINSGNQFKDYKGGIYECPNNGDFADSTKVDHAVVLVGYGVDGTDEYWILKNSYSSQWGEKGFFRLRMDTKINCGVNIFPVVPLGAKPGPVKPRVDGGGDTVFLSFTPSAWIAIAAVVTVATLVLTAVGVVIQRRRRMLMQEAVI